PFRHGFGGRLRASDQQILGSDDDRLGDPAHRGRLGLYRLLEARMTTETSLAPAPAAAAAQTEGLAPASTHGAAHHWGLERMLSVSTLLLFVWFLVSLLRLPALD